MKTVGTKTFVWIIITPLLLIAIISLLSQSTYADEEAYIISIPTNASVYMDDAFIGRTPQLINQGMPFFATIRIEMEGFETWSTNINVELDEREQVLAVLVPIGGDIQGAIQGAITVTTTATKTVTTTVVATATTTEISEVTAETGLPTEITYGAIGIAIISIIAAAITITRKRT